MPRTQTPRCMMQKPALSSLPASVGLRAEIKRPMDMNQDQIEAWRCLQNLTPWLDSPFYSPEFCLALGEAREDARIAVLHRAEELVGFFPFHLTGRAIGKPIGGPISDYHGPILRPDAKLSADELLTACGLRAYDFNHCPSDLQPLSSGALARSRSRRAVFRSGYQAYLAEAGPKLKHAIKETERRLRKIGREHIAASFCMDDKRPESLEWLIDTKTRALAKAGQKAGFHIPWFRKAIDVLWAERTTSFSGRLSTLSLGNTLIAAHFGLRAGPVLCWWHTTYDESYHQYAPGLALILRTILEGKDQGVSVIDFGRGDQDYKAVFGNDENELCEGAIALRGSTAAAMRHGHRVISNIAERLPLDRYRTLPRRAVGRLISNVRLPA